MVVFFILLTKIWDDPVFILLSFLCQSSGSSLFSPIKKWIISAILPLKARSFKITIQTLTIPINGMQSCQEEWNRWVKKNANFCFLKREIPNKTHYQKQFEHLQTMNMWLIQLCQGYLVNITSYRLMLSYLLCREFKPFRANKSSSNRKVFWKTYGGER